jgi:hypothetical protein
LYLIIIILCRKNLSQGDFMDYKILKIEEKEKVYFMGCLDYCHYFEIQ